MPPEPADPRPLTWWGHGWRLALVLAISAVAWGSVAGWQWQNDRRWLVLDLVVGIATLVLVQRRRDRPLAVALVVTLVSVVSFAAAGPALLALVSLSTRRRAREIVPVAALAVVTGTTLEALNPATDDTWRSAVGFTVGGVVLAVVLGVVVGSSHRLVPAVRRQMATVNASTMPTEPVGAPPLSWWGHAWRLVLVLSIAGVAWATFAEWQWKNDRWWFGLDLGLGLAALVLMHWRRRRPLLVALVVTLLGLVSATSGGPATLVLVSLATRRRWREIVPVALLSVAVGTFLSTVNPSTSESWWFNLFATMVVIGLTVGWGLYIGSRRELLFTLRQQLSTAEREQVMRVAQARTAERSRIAREMHDVLAHRISMVAMHAGALAYRTDLPAADVQRTTALIQESAHQALVDLREVLGILREESVDPENRPQPTMRDIPSLVEEARTTGSHVAYDNRLTDVVLPERIGRTTYRIVQEALTNARKHAPHTRVDVRVAGGPEEGVVITVTNPLQIGSAPSTAPPSGLGLIGLSERATLAGGTLDYRRDQKSFCIEARLPWPA